MVVMSKELMDGLDDLRLLGNDAEHVEAKTYQQVGKEEAEISLRKPVVTRRKCFSVTRRVAAGQ